MTEGRIAVWTIPAELASPSRGKLSRSTAGKTKRDTIKINLAADDEGARKVLNSIDRLPQTFSLQNFNSDRRRALFKDAAAHVKQFRKLQLRTSNGVSGDLFNAELEPNECVISLGIQGLKWLSRGFEDILAGKGDWAIENEDEEQSLSFWPLELWVG